MSLLRKTSPPRGSGLPLFRIDLDLYHPMIAAGLLGSDDRVELLDGLLVRKMPKSARHVATTSRIKVALEAVLPGGWYVRRESAIALPTGPEGRDSEPEPDLAVVAGTGDDDYSTRHPGPDDSALFVQVAETRPDRDRKKLRWFAWAGIPFVWIALPEARAVEVYGDPSGIGPDPRYRGLKTYHAGESIPLVIGGREVGLIDVAGLFPHGAGA